MLSVDMGADAASVVQMVIAKTTILKSRNVYKLICSSKNNLKVVKKWHTKINRGSLSARPNVAQNLPIPNYNLLKFRKV